MILVPPLLAQSERGSGADIHNAMTREGSDAVFSEGSAGPRADNGFVTSFVSETSLPDLPNVLKVSLRTGDAEIESVWFQDAVAVRIADVDVGADGTEAVVGAYDSSQNRTVSFLQLRDLKGSVKTTIDLGTEFEGERVCASPNQSLWVLGATDHATNHRKDTELLRNYNSQGDLLGSYLPRNTIAKTTVDFLGPNHRTTFLRCGQAGVLAYLGTYETLVAIGNSSNRESHYVVDRIYPWKVVGLAYLANGSIYGSIEEHSTNSRLSRLTLDDVHQRASWQPVGEAEVGLEDPSNTAIVIGQDQDRLSFFFPGYKATAKAPIVNISPH